MIVVIALIVVAALSTGIVLWVLHNKARAPMATAYPIDKESIALDGRSSAVATAAATATAQATNGDTDGAVQTLNTAIAATSNRDEKVSLYLQLGSVYANVGKKTEAVTATQAAINLDSTNWQLYKALGNVYVELGDNPDAVTSYKKADDALKGTDDYSTYHNEIIGLIGDAGGSE